MSPVVAPRRSGKHSWEPAGQLRQTLFMGDTLRGMLLNAYGWWFVGTIAMWVGGAAIAAGIVLGVIGFGPLRTKKGADVSKA